MEKIEKCANEISRVAHIIENDANNEFDGIIERLKLDEGNKVLNFFFQICFLRLQYF